MRRAPAAELGTVPREVSEAEPASPSSEHRVRFYERIQHLVRGIGETASRRRSVIAAMRRPRSTRYGSIGAPWSLLRTTCAPARGRSDNPPGEAPSGLQSAKATTRIAVAESGSLSEITMSQVATVRLLLRRNGTETSSRADSNGDAASSVEAGGADDAGRARADVRQVSAASRRADVVPPDIVARSRPGRRIHDPVRAGARRLAAELDLRWIVPLEFDFAR